MINEVSVYELCNQFENALVKRAYSQDSMYRYRRVLSEFKDFTQNVTFTPQLIAAFLTKTLGKGFSVRSTNAKKHMYYVRTMRSLEDYYLFGTFFRRIHEVVPLEWPTPFKEVLNSFFHEQDVKGISDSHKRKTAMVARDFILYLHRNSVFGLDGIRNEHISGFVASLVGFAPITVAGKISCLRNLFRFMYLNEYISIPLFEALPKSYKAYRTSVPTVWSQNELDRIKNAIDIGNPSGKRDYAIILLTARTGLRAGDVIDLKLQDINWERKEIIITQNKTSETLLLPLMDDVGWAIIDYIRNGRPATESDALFLRHQAPFVPFASSAALYTIITKYISRAGIKTDNKSRIGMHSLRHTLASELLQNDIEINTIADILGHSDPVVTKNYLQVNIKALRQCTLEVVHYEQ